MSAESARAALAEWASKSALKGAQLSEDGKTLSLDGGGGGGGPSLDASLEVEVTSGTKSCRYTLASIFLQIVDPDQGLMAYRGACKKHGVKDPVKALDKPTVVGFFLPGFAAATEAAAAGAAAAAAEASSAPPGVADHAAAADEPGGGAASASSRSDHHRHGKHHHHHKSSKDRHHRDSGSDRHRSSSDHHHRSKSSKDRHHHRSSSDRDRGSKGGSKKAKLSVTNEQLLENLNVVVGKREAGQHAEKAQEQSQEDLTRQAEITAALCADGFVVTPALIEENREATRRILSHEIPVGDSSSILRAANPKKDLARVLELYNEAIKPSGGKRDSSGRGGSSSSAAAANAAAASGRPAFKRKYLVGKKPVIVVPKGMTAPLTLINAHEFLCNGKFVPRDVMMKQGRQRSPQTTFTRNVMRSSAGGGSGATSGLLEYEIMDNPQKLGRDPREWERIVAVIVLGQAWQFKDWIAKYNTPVTLFSSTYGYYISMEGDKIPKEVEQGWAVKKAQLNRDKRGLDSITYTSFWNGLDEFMKVHRPELLPQAEH